MVKVKHRLKYDVCFIGTPKQIAKLNSRLEKLSEEIGLDVITFRPQKTDD